MIVLYRYIELQRVHYTAELCLVRVSHSNTEMFPHKTYYTLVFNDATMCKATIALSLQEHLISPIC